MIKTKNLFDTHKMTQAALIAAAYVALSVVLAPISYGAVQVRISEALTILAVFSPTAVAGLTIGCALSNLVGFMMGANVLGAFDILFGTAATLIAALLSYLLRNITIKKLHIASAIPPILVNALVVGAELCYVTAGTFHWEIFLVQAGSVFAGQFLACGVLGVPLGFIMEKHGLDKKFY